jgi:hypothetical protein
MYYLFKWLSMYFTLKVTEWMNEWIIRFSKDISIFDEVIHACDDNIKKKRVSITYDERIDHRRE